MSSAANINEGPAAPPPAAHSSASPSQFDFLDLKAQFASIREDVMTAIARVMESQHFILGPEVQLFERECSEFLSANHCIACGSGSDALLLALLALDVGPGDEVITTPFTFVATAGAIARVGAVPIFVDIDSESLNIDPSQIAAAITPRTRAIMPVHLFGLPADLSAILELAGREEIPVIEDAAQAIGARYEDRPVGTLGAVGCFSFFPSKNLGGAGDGGLITTQDAALADRLRILRVHGTRKKYHHECLGVNSRLDALQAAILRAKLPHLPAWTRARRERADFYRELFGTYALEDRVILPATPAGCTQVYNQFVIRSHDRDALRAFLTSRGIPTEIYYPLPLHLQPAFAYLGYRAGQLPVAEAVSQQVLALPIYPELTPSRQEQVVEAIAAFHARAN